MKRLHVLMTGATGYLGSRTARALSSAGHRVTVLKRSTSSMGPLRGIPGLRVKNLEGLKPGAYLRTAGPFDLFFHAAALYGRKGESVSEVSDVNTRFPLAWLEASLPRVSAFISVGTSLDRFVGPYALSKAHFSEWGRLLSVGGRKRFVDVRLEHFYGPADDASKFLTHVVRACLSGARSLELTAGRQRRDFLWVDDAVEGLRVLIEKVSRLPTGFSIAGLGSGRSVSVRRLVEAVKRLSGARTRLDFGAIPYRANEPMSTRADNRTMNALGWRPRTTLEEGLQRMIAEERRP